MSEIERILDDLPSQLRHQGELEELKDYARFLEQQNKRYREVVENIVGVKKDAEFNSYAYMKLEIFEWAEKALGSDSE